MRSISPFQYLSPPPLLTSTAHSKSRACSAWSQQLQKIYKMHKWTLGIHRGTGLFHAREGRNTCTGQVSWGQVLEEIQGRKAFSFSFFIPSAAEHQLVPSCRSRTGGRRAAGQLKGSQGLEVIRWEGELWTHFKGFFLVAVVVVAFSSTYNHTLARKEALQLQQCRAVPVFACFWSSWCMSSLWSR